MIHNTIEKLKADLEQIKFGILKTTGNSLLKLSHSFMINTFKVDHNGHLWCSASALLPSESAKRKGFTAQLRYVHKAQGLFVKVTGHATVVHMNSPEVNEFVEKDIFTGKDNACFLKIKIEEVHYYRKKSISASTSFLQAVNMFTFKEPVLLNNGL
jgi:general stress protein 26